MNIRDLSFLPFTQARVLEANFQSAQAFACAEVLSLLPPSFSTAIPLYDTSVEQWFSAGVILLLRGHLVVSGDILGCHN